MRHGNLGIYAALVCLLLMQFLIRAHEPTHQPFFWDENRHMVRAADILEGVHPAKNSNGKFLLYMYLAPFHPERHVALHVSRTAVALFSLLGTAAMFALAWRLFDARVALIATVFYVVVPFALFYERMALADPMAGALTVLAAYAAVRLAQDPTYRMAMIAGALASLATMAKVTVTFAAIAMPVLAAYAMGYHQVGSKQSWWQWLVARWRRYWWYWVTAGLTYIVLWLPTLVPAFISGVQGNDYVLVDQTSIDTSFLSENDEVRYSEFPNQLATMLSWPMLLVLVGAIGIGIWKLPRRTLFMVSWIALIWGPTAILVWRTQTRYLMAGVLPLAMLLGAAIVTCIQLDLGPNVRRWRTGAAIALASFFIGWMALFALPFAYGASTDVASLHTTRWDNRDYFQAPWNAYGLLPALDYLSAEGQVGSDGVIQVMSISQMCPFLDLYSYPRLELTCLHGEDDDRDYDGARNGLQWQQATRLALAIDDPLYLVLEQHRRTFEIPEIPYAHPHLAWTQLTAFQRPKGGLWVTVWHVEHTADQRILG